MKIITGNINIYYAVSDQLNSEFRDKICEIVEKYSVGHPTPIQEILRLEVDTDDILDTLK